MSKGAGESHQHLICNKKKKNTMTDVRVLTEFNVYIPLRIVFIQYLIQQIVKFYGDIPCDLVKRKKYLRIKNEPGLTACIFCG